ncbi:hypothetical protein KIN20_025376 [Parelaphostrongylus tenuis]|uniref:Uncharacterized protein n=1 Tax=Parelaphostrongylus tenuis TaxID=148309 RepID=A0AAD5MV81_PARTN|nr:hypothetical protein KIN20_025376 [Parelaphostrongylus tenuis]
MSEVRRSEQISLNIRARCFGNWEKRKRHHHWCKSKSLAIAEILKTKLQNLLIRQTKLPVEDIADILYSTANFDEFLREQQQCIELHTLVRTFDPSGEVVHDLTEVEEPTGVMSIRDIIHNINSEFSRFPYAHRFGFSHGKEIYTLLRKNSLPVLSRLQAIAVLSYSRNDRMLKEDGSKRNWKRKVKQRAMNYINFLFSLLKKVSGFHQNDCTYEAVNCLFRSSQPLCSCLCLDYAIIHMSRAARTN